MKAVENKNIVDAILNASTSSGQEATSNFWHSDLLVPDHCGKRLVIAAWMLEVVDAREGYMLFDDRDIWGRDLMEKMLARLLSQVGLMKFGEVVPNPLIIEWNSCELEDVGCLLLTGLVGAWKTGLMSKDLKRGVVLGHDDDLCLWHYNVDYAKDQGAAITEVLAQR